MKNTQKIKKLLTASIIAGTIYGLLALLTGLMINYNVLLLDGVYTMVGALMSLIALYIAKFIQTQDFERFPFGKESLMPLVVFIQYSVILLISSYGLIESFFSLLYADTYVDLAIGLPFSLFGTLFCFVFYLYLKKNPINHSFYKVELEQWRFGFLFSLGVVVSIIVSALLARTPYLTIAQLIDPVISIGITIFYIYLSVTEIKNATLELTYAPPKYELREKILLVVDKLLQNVAIETYVLRIAKVGDQVILELDIVILPDSELDSIRAQDRLRDKLNRKVTEGFSDYSLWLNINFIGDLKWA